MRGTIHFVPIQQTLLAIKELHSFSDLSTFSQNIPVEWVESVLQLSSKATIRRRRLPSEQVLWLVMGMALFRNEPVCEVARRLNICAKGLENDALLARSGLSEAWQRLGASPVEWLFKRAVSYPEKGKLKTVFTSLPANKFSTEQVAELIKNDGKLNWALGTSSHRCRTTQ